MKYHQTVSSVLSCCLSMKNYSLSIPDMKPCTLLPHPCNYLGYGIPDAKLVLNQMEGKVFELNKVQIVKAKGKYTLSLVGEEKALVFHKSNTKSVESQEIANFTDGKLIIVKPEKIKFSTVILKDKIIEIKWK